MWKNGSPERTPTSVSCIQGRRDRPLHQRWWIIMMYLPRSIYRPIHRSICRSLHSVSFIRTSNFGAEAERSYIFLRFEAENVLKMFLNYIYTTYISVNSMRTWPGNISKWLWQTEMCVTIVNVIQNMPLRILVNLHLLPWFYTQISKIKTFLIDFQPEECS